MAQKKTKDISICNDNKTNIVPTTVDAFPSVSLSKRDMSKSAEQALNNNRREELQTKFEYVLKSYQDICRFYVSMHHIHHVH
jgi:hypothetical protein